MRPTFAVTSTRFRVSRAKIQDGFASTNLCGALGGPSLQLAAIRSSVESDISGKNSKETELDSTISSSSRGTVEVVRVADSE